MFAGSSLVAATDEEEQRVGEGPATRGRAVAECWRGEEERAGSTETGRSGVEVAVVERQGGASVASSPLSRPQIRRERLARRLRAIEWRGAVGLTSRGTGEGAPVVDVSSGRSAAGEREGAMVAEAAVPTQTGLEVAAPRDSVPDGEPERVAGAAAAYHELSVRQRERGIDVGRQRGSALRRQRRVEIEAEEDLRLELVR